MILFLRRCALVIISCLPSILVAAQKVDIIPESGREQLRRLPEEARDTVYRRWGTFFYAQYTEEGVGKALECYTAALKIAQKYKHEEIVRMSYYDLATVYDAMNNYYKAREYYELVFAEQLRAGDPQRIFRSAYNLATVASKADDRVQVRLYAAIMQKHLKSIKDREYQLRGNLMLANLLSRNHDTTQFLLHYHLLPENAVFKDEGLAFGRLYAETKSNYLYYKGLGEESLQPLNAELKNTADSIPLLTLIVNRLEEIGNYKEALQVKRVLDKKVASHTSTSMRNDIEKRMLGMDNELMERKNQLLELQQTHLLQQRRQLYGIATMLLIGFLIATYSFFRIKGQNQKIKSQNEQILLQHGNIDTLLREVHHRVKNNLQIINSVVELQQLKPDVSPTESIKEMQIKMQSIALAHELVYEQEHIEYVPLQEYFNKLFAIIVRIYQVPAGRLVCNIEMNQLKLNLDKTLLLALAVNELVINTLKHVYPIREQCRIDLVCIFDSNRYTFCYMDNGPGLPANIDPQRGGNIGMRLVRNLIKQLGGTVEIKSNTENLEYIVTFTP